MSIEFGKRRHRDPSEDALLGVPQGFQNFGGAPHTSCCHNMLKLATRNSGATFSFRLQESSLISCRINTLRERGER